MDLTVKGGDELAALARRLRRQADGKELRRELSQGLRQAVKPMVPEVRAAVRAIPVKGRETTGLRAAIARAVQVKVNLAGWGAGVRIRVDAKRTLGERASLAALLEGRRKWRHPVFGDRSVVVEQESHPYLHPTLEPRAPAVRRELLAVVDRIARKVEG